MNTTFFNYICDVPNQEDYLFNIIPLDRCQCTGSNYYGMPSLQFNIEVLNYQVNFMYNFEPY